MATYYGNNAGYGYANQPQAYNGDAARAYWGDLVSPTDAANYRSSGLSNLTVALYDFAKSTSHIRVPRQAASDAKPTLQPEMVLDILSVLLDIPVLPFNENDPEASNLEVLDAALLYFYRLLNVKYQMGSRSEGSPVHKTPLLFRSSLYNILDFLIFADPNGMQQKINTVLTGSSVLYDPSTDEPFQYKSIPRSCFPAAARKDCMDQWTGIMQTLQREKLALIRQGMAQVEASNNEMWQQQSAANSLLQAQAMENQSTIDGQKSNMNALGVYETGWVVDQYGNRVYYQG
jgi:hypothetical protein